MTHSPAQLPVLNANAIREDLGMAEPGRVRPWHGTCHPGEVVSLSNFGGSAIRIVIARFSAIRTVLHDETPLRPIVPCSRGFSRRCRSDRINRSMPTVPLCQSAISSFPLSCAQPCPIGLCMKSNPSLVK